MNKDFPRIPNLSELETMIVLTSLKELKEEVTFKKEEYLLIECGWALFCYVNRTELTHINFIAVLNMKFNNCEYKIWNFEEYRKLKERK